MSTKYVSSVPFLRKDRPSSWNLLLNWKKQQSVILKAIWIPLLNCLTMSHWKYVGFSSSLPYTFSQILTIVSLFGMKNTGRIGWKDLFIISWLVKSRIQLFFITWSVYHHSANPRSWSAILTCVTYRANSNKTVLKSRIVLFR